MNPQRDTLKTDIYFRLMCLIEKKPHVSQREIANQLGVSLGGINYCLKALVERGYVKVFNFTNNPRKLSYVYLLTPTGIAEKTALAGQFLKRKLVEYEALKAEIELLQANSMSPKKEALEKGPTQ